MTGTRGNPNRPTVIVKSTKKSAKTTFVVAQTEDEFLASLDDTPAPGPSPTASVEPASSDVDDDEVRVDLGASCYGREPFAGVMKAVAAAATEQATTVSTEPVDGERALNWRVGSQKISQIRLNLAEIEDNLTECAGSTTGRLGRALEDVQLLRQTIQNIPFFAGLDEYLEAWDIMNVIEFFISKKLKPLRITTPKEDAPVVVNFALFSQEFVLCVDCFLAGRLPDECINFGYLGYLNHRKQPSVPGAGVRDCCKNFVPMDGYMEATLHDSEKQDGKQAQPRHNVKEGVKAESYRHFFMPFINDKLEFQFRIVDKNGTSKRHYATAASDRSKWLLPGRHQPGDFLEWIFNLVSDSSNLHFKKRNTKVQGLLDV